MNKTEPLPSYAQRGIVTVWAVVFLIVSVTLTLALTLRNTGANSLGNAQQMDSTRAFFIAESGIERAMSTMSAAAGTSGMNQDICKNMVSSGPFLVGGEGRFSYASATSTPDPCTGDACTGCLVRVTGKAGTPQAAARTLEFAITTASSGGSAGFGGHSTNIDMTLKNTKDYPAIAFFNLAWRINGSYNHSGSNGNTSANGCVNLSPSVCGLNWLAKSSNGQVAIGSMGLGVKVGAKPATVAVQETLAEDRNYAIVGALFPSASSTAPQLVGSTTVGTPPNDYAANVAYWDMGTGANGSKTINNNGGSDGLTNSGVATSTTAGCQLPTSDIATNPAAQTCTSWCKGADTLVFGVAGKAGTGASADITARIGSVTFNVPPGGSLECTHNCPANIPLEKVAHFPNFDGTTPGAEGDIYSEIWYAYNPPYQSADADATSGSVSGAIGATFDGQLVATTTTTTRTFTATATKTGSSKNVLTGVYPPPVGVLSVGDVLTAQCAANPFTITPTSPTVVSVTNTTITISANALQNCTGSFSFAASTAGPTRLRVANWSGGLIETGAALVGPGVPTGTTVQSFVSTPPGGGNGDYELSVTNLSPASSVPMHTTSTTLTVAAAPAAIGHLYPGDTISGGGVTAVIGSCGNGVCSAGYANSGGTTGTYGLDGGPWYVAPGTPFQTQTVTLLTEGATPPTPVYNSLTLTDSTILAVTSGTGVFPVGTRVASMPVTNGGQVQFKVTAAPTTPLNGASICGGTCAFFNNPSSTTVKTAFSVVTAGGTTSQWAGGFACLKGVDKGGVTMVTSSRTTTSTWHEVVQ